MFYFFPTRLGLLISTESAQKRLRIYPIDTRWNDFGKIVFLFSSRPTNRKKKMECHFRFGCLWACALNPLGDDDTRKLTQKSLILQANNGVASLSC